MEDLILSSPLWISVFVVASASVSVSVFFVVLLRRIFGHERMDLNNEVAGFKYAVIGAIYGVLLAFITMIVYEEYKDGRHTVDNEARAIFTLYRLSEGLTGDMQPQIRESLKRYASSVVTDEWPLLKEGKEAESSKVLMRTIWKNYMEFVPKGEKESSVYNQSLSVLHELYSARRHRVISSQTELPGIMWFVLLAGGFITISFSFFFSTPNLKAQILMTALVTLLISLSLSLIALLDNPFSGPVSLNKRPYLHILEVMKEYRSE